MNVAIILSGGVGQRFGSPIPKQYLTLCDKPVIQYVIDEAENAKSIDKIVLVMNQKYKEYVEVSDKVHIVNGGKERLDSVYNGLSYIKENFNNCKKVIILQAVNPFVKAKLIDEYMTLLDKADVVTTAEKCTGEIFDIKAFKRIDRDDYYFCNSPEAFKFEELYKYIDVNSKYSELIYHYPYEPKIHFYLNFDNNLKITYRADLDYYEYLMNKEKERE